MTYNVLAINPGHNGSAALVCDGKLELYIEEERMTRAKYDGNPFKAMMYIIDRYFINELIIAGTGQENIVFLGLEKILMVLWLGNIIQM